MKKLIAVLFLIAFCSFNTQTEKTFTVKFSEASLNYHWGNLNAIKQVIDQSTLPHTQVVFMMGAIDSLQREIAPQIKEQVKTK